jgi:hypothetical protein
MFMLVAVVVETLSGPLLVLAWLARAFLLCGVGLFLIASPFTHNAAGIALLYLGQAVAMTFIIRLLRRLRVRALYRAL